MGRNEATPRDFEMNFLSRFFTDPKDLFKQLPVNHSEWTVLTWNWDLHDVSERRRTLELNNEHHYQVALNKEELIFVQDKKVKAFPFKDEKEIKDRFNLACHLSVKHSLESTQSFMRKTMEGDLNEETRTLQWLQASFKTLEGALKRVEENPDLILTAAFFSGINPELKQQVLRLICFNLDINFFMQEDGLLRIVVFDDKNLGHGSQKTANLNQIIRLTKPLFYDEITKLLNQLTTVGEVR